MTSIAFFNNKGGVGKTSLVYHLAWMYSELGLSVIAADIDPQANLSSAFLSERRLNRIWTDSNPSDSLLECLSPILRGLGDIREPHVESVKSDLGLIVGNLGLSRFEDRLSTSWASCMASDEAAFRSQSAFHRILVYASQHRSADLVLIDVGPNLGAINRAAIIASDFVVFPLGPDLFSLQALRNVGPTLQSWKTDWKDRLERRPTTQDLDLPSARTQPAGYIVMQHAIRRGRPVQAYERWIRRMPSAYKKNVLDDESESQITEEDDSNCLGILKHYRSLMAMSHESRKPMFHLKPADGALGSHIYAVQDCYEDFRLLAKKIAATCNIQHDFD